MRPNLLADLNVNFIVQYYLKIWRTQNEIGKNIYCEMKHEP